MDQGYRISRTRSQSCHRLSTTSRSSYTSHNFYCELKHNDSVENLTKKIKHRTGGGGHHKRTSVGNNEMNETLLKSEELIHGANDAVHGGRAAKISNDALLVISKSELKRRFDRLMARAMQFSHPDDALPGDKTEKYALRYHSNFCP